MSIKGKAVRPGDTIGVIAFSAPCERQRFEEGVRNLSALGYRVKVALDPCAQYGRSEHLFSSDAPERRVAALHEFLSDPEVGAIIAARGAYGSMELLPLIDFSLLRQYPKIICGFSDTTVLLTAAYSLSSVAMLHAASLESCFSKFAIGAGAKRSGLALLEVLSGNLLDPYSGVSPRRLCGTGNAEGRLFGGNLSSLSALVGSAWEGDWRDHILFIEEVGEKPYRVHRMLLQLKLAGKLAQLRGVVLGSFRDCRHATGLGPSIEDVFCDIFAGYGYPVLADLPFGHDELNLPMPLGVQARINGNKLEFLETVVSL